VSKTLLEGPISGFYWYSIFTGERELRPLREERGTANSCCGIVTVGLTRPTLHTVNYPKLNYSVNSCDIRNPLFTRNQQIPIGRLINSVAETDQADSVDTSKCSGVAGFLRYHPR